MSDDEMAAEEYREAERRIWDGLDSDGNDKYVRATIFYHSVRALGIWTNVADAVEYEKFEHRDGEDDPVIVADLDDMLDDIEVHPCELNSMTDRFELVACAEGCELCR